MLFLRCSLLVIFIYMVLSFKIFASLGPLICSFDDILVPGITQIGNCGINTTLKLSWYFYNLELGSLNPQSCGIPAIQGIL